MVEVSTRGLSRPRTGPSVSFRPVRGLRVWTKEEARGWKVGLSPDPRLPSQVGVKGGARSRSGISTVTLTSTFTITALW